MPTPESQKNPDDDGRMQARKKHQELGCAIVFASVVGLLTLVGCFIMLTMKQPYVWLVFICPVVLSIATLGIPKRRRSPAIAIVLIAAATFVLMFYLCGV